MREIETDQQCETDKEREKICWLQDKDGVV